MACYKKLTESITATCTFPLVPGIDDEIYVINYEDIESFTLNAQNDNIIEGITLKSASPALSGFKITGFRYSNEYENSLVKGRYINEWEQKLTIRIFDNSPDVKERIDELANGRFVFIIKNRYQNANGNSVYEVLGYTNGLEMTECKRNPDDKDLRAGWVCTFSTGDFGKEHYPAKTFFITDLDTTKTALEALV